MTISSPPLANMKSSPGVPNNKSSSAVPSEKMPVGGAIVNAAAAVPSTSVSTLASTSVKASIFKSKLGAAPVPKVDMASCLVSAII